MRRKYEVMEKEYWESVESVAEDVGVKAETLHKDMIKQAKRLLNTVYPDVEEVVPSEVITEYVEKNIIIEFYKKRHRIEKSANIQRAIRRVIDMAVLRSARDLQKWLDKMNIEDEGDLHIFTVDDIGVAGKTEVYTMLPVKAKVREEDMAKIKRIMSLPRKYRQKYKFVIRDGYLEFV